MIHRYLILLIFSLPFFSGCSLATQMMYQPEIDQAELLFRQGKNQEAAVIYQKLAELETNQRNQFQLLAADALIASGNIAQGKKYVDAIVPSQLTPIQFNHLKLLQGQILFNQGEGQRALKLLLSVKVGLLDKRSQYVYYTRLATTYISLKAPINSVRALISLDPLVRSAQKRQAYFKQILNRLLAIPTDVLSKQPTRGSKTLEGWIALTEILRHHQDLGAQLAQWRQQYPLHPVTSDLLLTYEKTYKNKQVTPKTIAIFLPKSGKYSEAARVIKKGFMTAYQLASKHVKNQPKVIFYDTEKKNIVTLYAQAIKKGAQLVIGPLNKKHLNTLVKGTKLSIPVLALNHVEGLSYQNLYQFGLSPIDDAAEVANKAYLDGYKNALLLIPASARGKRIGNYFARHWQGLGANTIGLQTYDASKNNFKSTLKKVVTQIENNPVDLIFMNAYAKQGFQLNPQLLYQKETANLPIYATSHIYQGTPNTARDKKLNGVVFCDIPWVFDTVYTGALSKKSLEKQWKKLSPLYLRLLPLGIDAYNLIGHLSSLKSTPYPGATGRLTLGVDYRINRELFCAQFVDGQPNLLNFSSEKSKFTP